MGPFSRLDANISVLVKVVTVLGIATASEEEERNAQGLVTKRKK